MVLRKITIYNSVRYIPKSKQTKEIKQNTMKNKKQNKNNSQNNKQIPKM